jgi:hypothetical protein
MGGRRGQSRSVFESDQGIGKHGVSASLACNQLKELRFGFTEDEIGRVLVVCADHELTASAPTSHA